jgi:tungstate transport system substrate-binding protein
MNKNFLFLFIFVCIGVFFSMAIAEDKCTEVYGTGMNKFSLATGSPGELGLLKALAEGFMAQSKDI